MMTKEEVLDEIKKRKMDDIIELIEDAEAGQLEELEIVESIGLLYDRDLNHALIQVFKDLGVEIVYVSDDEESE
ncbi:hypothetical protein ACFFHM_06715 [Halalkalibacter kiskunsagensis]|uniref:Uncharacterized protein n=2 Tax=Halalkalibacter kiskunsagensis TaxID=1548599 RepID=A0ABV6KB11_9BACI